MATTYNGHQQSIEDERQSCAAVPDRRALRPTRRHVYLIDIVVGRRDGHVTPSTVSDWKARWSEAHGVVDHWIHGAHFIRSTYCRTAGHVDIAKTVTWSTPELNIDKQNLI